MCVTTYFSSKLWLNCPVILFLLKCFYGKKTLNLNLNRARQRPSPCFVGGRLVRQVAPLPWYLSQWITKIAVISKHPHMRQNVLSFCKTIISLNPSIISAHNPFIKAYCNLLAGGGGSPLDSHDLMEVLQRFATIKSLRLASWASGVPGRLLGKDFRSDFNVGSPRGSLEMELYVCIYIYPLNRVITYLGCPFIRPSIRVI